MTEPRELKACGVCGAPIEYVPCFDEQGERDGTMRPKYTRHYPAPLIEAVEMMSRIECPAKCDNGAIPYQTMPDGHWEADQCEWCAKLSAAQDLLKKGE